MINKPKIKKILWKDIKIGNKFIDGSNVVGIHDTNEQEVYRVSYEDKLHKILSDSFGFIKNFDPIKEMILSDRHLLLVDLKFLPKDALEVIDYRFGKLEIPTVWNRHVYYENPNDMKQDEAYGKVSEMDDLEKSHIKFNGSYMEKMELAKADPAKVSDTEFWLEVSTINDILNQGFKVLCNNHLLHIKYLGKKEVFCVETDSHKYETNGLIHHNSVMLQNVIFHCLTHGNDMTIAMVDLKRTEMAIWKEHKNVLLVANTVKEARELLLIGRRLMDKRNEEMQKLGLKDIMNYVPTHPTGEIRVAGRKFKGDDRIDIKLPSGEEKNVSIDELEKYLIWK